MGSRSNNIILTPVDIARLYELHSCPYYVRLLLEHKLGNLKNYGCVLNVKRDVDKILSKRGSQFELSILNSLSNIFENPVFYGFLLRDKVIGDIPKNYGFFNGNNKILVEINSKGQCIRESLKRLIGAPGNVYILYQPCLEGEIGLFRISGRADFVIVDFRGASPKYYVLEAKFTSEEKLSHRVQAVTYAALLSKALASMKQGKEVYLSVISKSTMINQWPPTNTLKYPEEVLEYNFMLNELLGKDGLFERILKGEEVLPWHTMRCSKCIYEPICIGRAVKDRHLGLLGIQPGYQKILMRAGVKNLEDLASLYEFNSSRPTDFSPPLPRRSETVASILKESENINLPRLSKMAQVLSKEIERRVGDSVYPEFIPGSGFNLPKEEGHDYPKGSLVRVYVYVQYSPIYDLVIGASAIVENTLTGSRIEIVHTVEKEPSNNSEASRLEENLLSLFFRNLLEGIKTAAPILAGQKCGETERECSNDDIFVHIYFYSWFQRIKLMEAVKRHLSIYGSEPIRAILSFRKAIDQQCCSIIRDDLVRRHALRFHPGLSIIVASSQFLASERGSVHSLRWNELAREFREVFEILAEKKEDGSIVLPGGECLFWNLGRYGFGGYKGRRGIVPTLYPVLNRMYEQIPPSIFWGSYENGKKSSLKRLMLKLAEAIRHIERSVPDGFKDGYVKKEPISRSNLDTMRMESIRLPLVLMEYLKLEHDSRLNELEEYYRMPLSSRVSSGRSLIMRVEKRIKERGNDYLRGKIYVPSTDDPTVYTPYNPEDSPLISLDEGSFVAIIEHESITLSCHNGDCIRIQVEGRRDPMRIARSAALGRIDYIDLNTGNVGVSVLPSWAFHTQEFVYRHRMLSKHVGRGSVLALEPLLDDINMARAFQKLKEIAEGASHPLLERLEQVYESSVIKADDMLKYRIACCSRSYVEEFLEVLMSNSSKGNTIVPNERQREFILDTDHFLLTLQGPPGTGKTAGAIAPAIFARAYSLIKENDRNALFIVTGISHRAINEVLIRTSAMLNALKSTVKELNNVKLVRVASSENGIAHIKKVLLKDGFDPDRNNVEVISADDAKMYLSAARSKPLYGYPSIYVLFATPATIIKIDNKFMGGKSGSKTEARARLTPHASLIVIDEASMMDLPMFVSATLLAGRNSQVMLVGDHRQMQPIQSHPWDVEDRKTIDEHVPFLSAINFIRFLRGDMDLDEIQRFRKILIRTPPLWEFEAVKNSILPMYRLEETHRLPEVAARMHSDLIYLHDGIRLKSRKTASKKDILRGALRSVHEKWLSWILDPDYTYVIVEHYELYSTRANDLEAEIVSKIVEALPDGIEVGVVVPYRAHKSLIYKKLRGKLGERHRRVLVDTVERFQGAEKDFIIISMASSDPTYLSTVFDFIYDPNRFNVAASRMKEKLVLIASKSFFASSPRDLDQFEKVRVWKKFYLRVKGSGESMRAILNGKQIRLYRLDKW